MDQEAMQNPFLVGPRLYLRPLQPEQDSEKVAHWNNDEQMRSYSNSHEKASKEQRRTFTGASHLRQELPVQVWSGAKNMRITDKSLAASPLIHPQQQVQEWAQGVFLNTGP